MPDIETVTRAELDELRDDIRAIRRLLVTTNGADPAPAAAPSNTSDAALLVAIEELTDEVRHLRQDGLIGEEDAERIADCLADRFIVEEEPEGEPKGRKGKKARSGGEPEADPEMQRKRGYFTND